MADRIPLQLAGHIALPPHAGKGGFDHAAPHAASGHIYVAHTANDAVDVFDPAGGRYLFSVLDLPGASGVLVSDDAQLIIASARGENTIGVFGPGRNPRVRKAAVGIRPNGLAFDYKRGLILAANVGDPTVPGSYTLSMVDLASLTMRHSIAVAGRTRWALYDADSDSFYVNIMEPSQIVVVEGSQPDRVARVLPVPAAGAHGLDLDAALRLRARQGGVSSIGARRAAVAMAALIDDEGAAARIADLIFLRMPRMSAGKAAMYSSISLGAEFRFTVHR